MMIEVQVQGAGCCWWHNRALLVMLGHSCKWPSSMQQRPSHQVRAAALHVKLVRESSTLTWGIMAPPSC
jgi:hypothetical protein